MSSGRAIQRTDKSHCPHCHAYVELVYRISDSEPLWYICRACQFAVNVGKAGQIPWEGLLDDIIEASRNSVFASDGGGKLHYVEGRWLFGNVLSFQDQKGWPADSADTLLKGHFIGHDG
jgi:hypothetical protein